jgi:hypothetical protein
MSHPKNSKTPEVTQQPLTTEHQVDELMSVRSGVPVLDALELSSCRMSELLSFIRDHVDEDDGLKVSAVYLAQEHLIGAKAMLDSCISGLMQAERVGGGL